MLRGLAILSFSVVTMIFIAIAMCLLYTYLPIIHFYNLYDSYIEMEASESNLLFKSIFLSIWMELDCAFKSHLSRGEIPNLIKVNSYMIMSELSNWNRLKVEMPDVIVFSIVDGKSFAVINASVKCQLVNGSFLKFCPLYESNFRIHISGKFISINKSVSMIVPALYRVLIPCHFWKAYLSGLIEVAGKQYHNFTSLENNVRLFTKNFTSKWFKMHSLKNIDVKFTFHFIPGNASGELLLKVQLCFSIIDNSRLAKLNAPLNSSLSFSGCFLETVSFSNVTSVDSFHPFSVLFRFSS